MTKKRQLSIQSILEKARKKKADGQGTFSFSDIEFRRRREVIQPYLHYLDQNALRRGLSYFFENHYKLSSTLQNICDKKSLNVPVEDFTKYIMDAYKAEKIPNHFINDLFNYYYLNPSIIEFAPKQPYNLVSYKTLTKLNSPIMKILTNHFHIKTLIMVRSLLLQVYFAYALRKHQNDPKAESLFNSFSLALSLPVVVKTSRSNPKTSNDPSSQKTDSLTSAGQIQPSGISPKGNEKPSSNNSENRHQENNSGSLDKSETNQGTVLENNQDSSENRQNTNPSSKNNSGSGNGNQKDNPIPTPSGIDSAEQSEKTAAEPKSSSGSQKTSTESHIGNETPEHNDNSNESEQEIENHFDQEALPDADIDFEDSDEEDFDGGFNDNTPNHKPNSKQASNQENYGLGDLDSFQDSSDDFAEDKLEDYHNEGSFSDDTIRDSSNDYGSITNSDLEKQVEDILNYVLGDKIVMEFAEATEKETREACSYMEDVMSAEDMLRIWEDLSRNSPVSFTKDMEAELSKTDHDHLETIWDELKKIKLNFSKVKHTIKKLLDKSNNYFSERDEPIFVPLFDAESLHGLQDYELLHATLRKVFFDDIHIKETHKAGKIDVYWDISSSMNLPSGLLDDNEAIISKATFAKAILLKLKESNMINDLYIFNDKVSKKNNSLFEILSTSSWGSTDINAVIRNVKKNNNNSLIITDAEDDCNQYDDRVFFLGVYGADYSDFKEEVRRKYAEKSQWCIFDGKVIYDVNVDGLPVKT